ncbi:phosphonopyruvate decarboxylase [Treponema putidum]|uniref:Phosphonopyruvate decarboxylase n=1 Tax=Treponema putidum TaxID=221027 RepID=A0AAE9SGW7_9SPIR|nr:phosphonopyruvate decarboxylase [Treponema putidum]UTY28283.1 phosphonopyruvate decarboxylase [Treponema putidum]UTY33198.1 phosphonopyruvate decarboxylase [Treponema putidum]
MIRPQFFYELLKENGTGFFTGVPDSLLKNFCAYLTDTAASKNHIIAANEGCAVGLAAGHYFATGRVPLVYMQNSGLGNTVNPLLSLADKEVYSVPLLLVIGWRGEPGVHDEPQHIKQGRVTCSLLDAMEIPYSILSDKEEEAKLQLEKAYSHIKASSSPYAVVVRKGIFDSYTLKTNEAVPAEISREQAIEQIILNAPLNAVFVSTTGMASRELYELRDKHGQGHAKDFLTVGSMGHASQIALGIALSKSDRKIFCIDGDGAAIMHMGALSTIGTQKPKNMVHFVLNNGAHDSVGGQPTVARKINLCAVAEACGYDKVVSVKTLEELQSRLKELCTNSGSVFIEVLVSKGARADLGRPKSSPIENKKAFMEFLEGKK